MIRYSRIKEKDPREIVLLTSRPCQWGRCFFCDYVDDNSEEDQKLNELNSQVLQSVTGEFKKLEIINSASVFELPKETLKNIKDEYSYLEDMGNVEILWKTTDFGVGDEDDY